MKSIRIFISAIVFLTVYGFHILGTIPLRRSETTNFERQYFDLERSEVLQPPLPTLVKTGQIMRGIASWYGPGFHGRKTANGERYDMYRYTAAHKTLRLGTYLEVRNIDSGRTVIVKINDRGPYIGGRVLDLSFAAAKQLKFAEKGLARVEARILGEVPYQFAQVWQ